MNPSSDHSSILWHWGRIEVLILYHLLMHLQLPLIIRHAWIFHLSFVYHLWGNWHIRVSRHILLRHTRRWYLLLVIWIKCGNCRLFYRYHGRIDLESISNFRRLNASAAHTFTSQGSTSDSHPYAIKFDIAIFGIRTYCSLSIFFLRPYIVINLIFNEIRQEVTKRLTHTSSPDVILSLTPNTAPK